jgi:murein DD-endopeptidase / murein LD-carboxypeptidase
MAHLPYIVKLTGVVIASAALAACGSSRKTSANFPKPAAPAAGPLQIKYAQLIGIQPQQLANTALYQFIDEWMNTPYQYGGQTKKGADCSGFTYQLFAAVYDKNLPRQSAAQSQLLKALKAMSQLAEGDLVFFKTGGSTTINHVGVYLHNQKMVSATTSAGVVISDIGSGYWKAKFVGGGSVK